MTFSVVFYLLLAAYQCLALALFWGMVPIERRYSRPVCYGIAVGILAARAGAAAVLRILTRNSTTALQLAANGACLLLGAAAALLIAALVCDMPPRRRLRCGLPFLAFWLGSALALDALCGVPSGVEASDVLSRVLFPLLFLLLTTLAACAANRVEKAIRWKLTLLAALFVLSQSVLLVILWRASASWAYGAWLGLLCAAVTAAAAYLLYNTLTATVAAQRDRLELEQLQEQQQADYVYYQKLQKNVQEMARYRHDVKNQLQVIYALLHDTEQAERVVTEIDARISGLRLSRYCESPVVNAILSVKADEAKRRGIDFRVSADVGRWPVEEIDQSNLFSNLLDNALENCAGEAPFVEVRAGERRGVYLVRVRNSCAPELRLKNGEPPPSSKGDALRHGNGVKILRAIAARYHGQLTFACADGVFTAAVYLEAPN